MTQEIPEPAQVEERVITEIRMRQWDGNGPTFWEIDMVRPDGVKIMRLMPTELLESLSAEYDIPIDDVDTLIDVAIHRHYLPSARADTLLASSSAVPQLAARASAAEPEPGPEPVTLWNAPSIQAAREALLTQIAELKATRIRVVPLGQASPGSAAAQAVRDELLVALQAARGTSGLQAGALADALPAEIAEADPLDLIRATATFSWQSIKQKREDVASARAQLGAETSGETSAMVAAKRKAAA
ncbi:hypothetical protein ACIBH1_45845 [Nonomuraea sp. NPDC050663]|uniref:hypothetical protein n=1 Tax=Nonomuraea sp. NPDC050663 TaxID=3364370 RepID=UPI0037AA0B2C